MWNPFAQSAAEAPPAGAAWAATATPDLRSRVARGDALVGPCGTLTDTGRAGLLPRMPGTVLDRPLIPLRG